MSLEKYYLGIDVGSVSINLVLMDEDQRIKEKLYVRTEESPFPSLRRL